MIASSSGVGAGIAPLPQVKGAASTWISSDVRLGLLAVELGGPGAQGWRPSPDQVWRSGGITAASCLRYFGDSQ